MKKEKLRTKLKVAFIAVERGCHNPHQFSQLTGISYNRSEKIWHGEAKFSLADIDTICNVFGCEPGELFERENTTL